MSFLNPYRAVKQFFTRTIWDADYAALGCLRRCLYSFLRIVILAVRGFIGDRCTLQASALTYIALVSIVPVLAITLSFCKGIGLQRRLLNSLGIKPIVTQLPSDEGGHPRFEIDYEVIPAEIADSADPVDPADAPSASEATASAAGKGPGEAAATSAAPAASYAPAEEKLRAGVAAQLPEPMQLALVNVFKYVDKTNFAAIGIIGVIALLGSVIASIKKLENIFNRIWCVARGRSLPRQVCEYLVVLLFMPIVLLCVLSIHGFIISGELYDLLGTNSPTLLALGNFIARLVMGLFVVGGFSFLYIFMPNTKVRFLPALLGGVVAAICFGAVLCLYVGWQVGLSKYNAIYGTFAALPFFLGWLYANWTVVLLGAEVCYSAQFHRLLRADKVSQPLEPGACHLLGIVIMHHVCDTFLRGNGPWNAGAFAAEHNVSITELEQSLAGLRRSGLVLQLNPEAPPPQCYDYLPARPPKQLTLHDVAEAFTRLDSEPCKRIGKCLPEGLRQRLVDHHSKMVSELDFPVLAEAPQ